jgi:prenylcysteine alpha-carboxyl methylesterase
VLIFVSGGAWMIGYKVWPYLQALVLRANGVLVVCPDYRNFPQSDIEGMVADVDAAVQWTLSNLRRLNGDPNNVTLVGQSAGAHLVAMVVTQRAALEAAALPDDVAFRRDASMELPAWRLGQLRQWVGISGCYHLAPLIEVLHARGLDRRLVMRLIPDPQRLSPAVRVDSLSHAARAVLASRPVFLCHGKADVTVPVAQTAEFAQVLRRAGVPTEMELYAGKSHTDSILEGPMSGEDALMKRLLALVRSQAGPAARGTQNGGAGAGETAEMRDGPCCCDGDAGGGGAPGGDRDVFMPKVLPDAVLALARWVNPF